MINKKELYELLRADGAKLKAMNFYTVEQLCDIYFDRFGVIYTQNIVESKKEEQTADDNTPAENIHADNADNDEIRTLVFDRGGWCDELQKSYAMGIYRPATVKEYVVLKQFASKVL